MTNVVAKTEEAQSWNRGDVILATQQAARAYLRENPGQHMSTFDLSHAVVERLMADGFVKVPA